MNYKSISIVGVDGTGKSSIVEMLRETLGNDKCCVQYMGARLWETDFAKQYHEPQKGVKKNPVLVIFSFIYEMYYRIWKHHKSNKLIIFDRYVDEQILWRRNDDGFRKKIISILYTVFLGHLFHRPQMFFYLTCPIEVSLSRKSDITTEKEIEGLKRNKIMLDEYYCHQLNTTVIDTSQYSQAETLDIILKNIAPLL